MQAMNGSGGLGIRRFCRLLGCVAALVALSAMAVPSIAAAKKPVKVKETYLALGDSLAFGYSQQLFNENEKTAENPTAFEHGTPTTTSTSSTRRERSNSSTTAAPARRPRR